MITALNRHKSTLSLLLQILQCGFIGEAQNEASYLNWRTQRELEQDPGLAERLLHMGPLTGVAEESTSTTCEPLDNLLDSTPAEVVKHNFPSLTRRSARLIRGLLHNTIAEHSMNNNTFEAIVAQSRAYRHVEHLEIDAASICRSTRSHGWSILSGLSVSQVTCVGVISLPLSDNELVEFRTIASVSHQVDTPERTIVYPSPAIGKFPGGSQQHLEDQEWCRVYGLVVPTTIPTLPRAGCINRLRNELYKFGSDYPGGIRAGPLDNDITVWQATIKGPTGTPFEGGWFRLRIKYPHAYPFQPPKFTFRTKIFRPNIDDEGNISMDVLGARHTWKLTTLKLLLSISSLLDDPNVDEPLKPQIASLYKHDRETYDNTARAWTRLYASLYQETSGNIRKHQETLTEELVDDWFIS